MRRNYNREDLVREFEVILDDWKKITIFVKSGDTTERVSAFGSASTIAMTAIAQTNNEGIIRKGGYLFSNKYWINKKGSEIYSWTFELINLL